MRCAWAIAVIIWWEIYQYYCAEPTLYSTSRAINRVELDGSQRTTITTVGTRGVLALDFDIR